MTRVIVVVREVGSLKPDHGLEFDLPEVPKYGAYISIYRGDPPAKQSEDMIVEKVWWELSYPDGQLSGSAVGGAINIMVECTPAIGPRSTDFQRQMLEAHRARGGDVPEFDVSR